MKKYFNVQILADIWKRLTSSKLMWVSLGGAFITLARVLFDADITNSVNLIVDAIWAIIVVYLAANNPTTPDQF
jgi:hypothetical protein